MPNKRDGSLGQLEEGLNEEVTEGREALQCLHGLESPEVAAVRCKPLPPSDTREAVSRCSAYQGAHLFKIKMIRKRRTLGAGAVSEPKRILMKS